MRYDVILADADGTLFDYQRAARHALEAACALHGIPYGRTVLERYHEINSDFWDRYERGEVSQDELRTARFDLLGRALGIPVDSAAMNRDYTRELGEGDYLLEDAEALCRELSARCRLYIVTNGIPATQRRRLEKSPLAPYISGIFISGEMGCQKPQRAFFDRVFAAIGQPDRRRAVVLGDSQTSDMQGGKNAGVDTCWFAPPQAVDRIGCTWRVSRLMDFVPIAAGAPQQTP